MSGVGKDIEPVTADATGDARMATMEQLLSVYENTVLEQADKLFREISAHMMTEEALLENKRFLNAIIDGSPVPMFIIDKNHRVIYWNNALERYSGVRARQIIGTKRHSKAFYNAQRPCIADLLVEAEENNILFWYGTKIRKSQVVEGLYEGIDFFPLFGGKGAWLYLSAKTIRGANDRIIGAVEAIEDISEQKRAEEEIRKLNDELTLKVEQLLEAREELLRKEKLAVLGQLSGSVGHELRNPLGVMNNAVFLLSSLVPQSDEKVREYLEIIRQEIDNAQRIITDLLDFSRTRPPQTAVLTVREMVQDGVGKCVIPESVTLKTDLPETLPPIKVDPLQMEQIFQNLISNAVQAMPGGGTVRISARRVQGSRLKVQGSQTNNFEHGTLNVEPDADFVEISVEDTGVGISHENMKKLFQPLFTTKARGIGLGLTVCKNLAEANGGRIEAESDEGRGTRFVILLPTEG